MPVAHDANAAYSVSRSDAKARPPATSGRYARRMDQRGAGSARPTADARRQPPRPSPDGPGYRDAPGFPGGSAVGERTGPQRLVGPGSGAQPVLAAGSGGQPVLGPGSGSHPALGPTGPWHT